ncbi:MAG: hypothetical protein WC449_04800 [Candidatus Paceibacterota bacterium]
MTDNFELGFEDFAELYEDAEELLEQATSFSQIGRFSSKTVAKVYDNGSFREVSPKEWKAFSGFKMLELTAMVDTQEFNPELQKPYSRRIQVKAAPWNKKGDDGKYTRILSDWEAIFEPSVLSVTGLTDATAALKALQGKYVKVLDVKQQPTKKQPEPQYNTAKVVAVYNSREEAYADYLATKSGKGESTPVVPAASFSEDVVSAVKMLAGLKQDAATIAKSIGNLTEADVKTILGA